MDDEPAALKSRSIQRMDTMPPQLEGLLHRPMGIEHPYKKEADERTPRWPAAGEPVQLGLVTWPAGAAQRVWATYRVDDGEETTVEGNWVEDHQERSLWTVALPAFQAGQQVHYCLHAQAGPACMDTSEHAFAVPGWCQVGKLTRLSQLVDGIELVFAGDGLAPEMRYQVCFTAPDQLRFTFGPLNGPVEAVSRAEVVRVLAEDDGHLAVESAVLRLEAWLEPFRLELRRRDDLLLSTGTGPEWLALPGKLPQAVRLSFDSPQGEGFYGFGERYNALNQRGRKMDVQLFEQYKNQGERAYIPVPFFLSSLGYGFYLDTRRRALFDLAASQESQWSLEAHLGPQAQISFHLFAGSSPLENLHAFSAFVGKPQLPPSWAFGPWMSSNEWHTQAEVLKQARLTDEYGIPASVLVIEAWSDETTFYIWNGARYTAKPGSQVFSYADFTFPSNGPWPDPKAMIDELHRRGIRLVLWQIPVLRELDALPPSADHEFAIPGPELEAETPRLQPELDRNYALEKGYCLRYASGEPYRVRPYWFRGSLLWDPSSLESVEWWMSKRAYLLDELGVDGFKTDGGEHLWGDEVVFANGMCGDEGINVYANLYVGAYYQFANQRRNGDALTFSRAGFTGAQAFPCHWAGDENSTFEAFRASLCAGLNAGLSGIPFWGWDIGGFSGELPTAELYLRAAAMATFCPIMQYHSEFKNHQPPCNDRTPWNVAEQSGHPDVIDIYREFARLRMRLLPYIEAEARHCSETGEPLMRPLFLDWPGDPTCWQVEDQYCFGRSLLVAPVVQPGALERTLYLPAGEWEDFWSAERIEGGRWITVPAPLERIPVFKRRMKAEG